MSFNKGTGDTGSTQMTFRNKNISNTEVDFNLSGDSAVFGQYVGIGTNQSTQYQLNVLNSIQVSDTSSNLVFINQSGVNYIETFGPTISSGSYAPLYITNGYANSKYITIVPVSSGTSSSVGINKVASGSYTLDVSGNANFTGSVTANSFNATSDYRIKENIIKLNNEFTVDGLVPVKYQLKDSKKESIGFIAHELQEVYPFLVEGEKDGPVTQSVNYSGLIPIIVREIQELKKEILSIKDEILSIKDEILSIKDEININ
jgi:hypothetical protein